MNFLRCHWSLDQSRVGFVENADLDEFQYLPPANVQKPEKTETETVFHKIIRIFPEKK